MSDYITTYTGKHFEPMNPDPAAIDVRDIAHALSMICRGNGHVHTFWSVGEHCICCAREAETRGLPERMILACLLHDASECYMSDVPRPFKQSLPAYREHEDRLLSLIYEKFLGTDLSDEEGRQLKEIDNAMLWYDLKELLGEPQTGEKPRIHIELDYTARSFKEVEEEYLAIYEKYIRNVRNAPVKWKIKHIFDGDYGCEERLPGESPKVSVTLVNESGEEKCVSVEDGWLIGNQLDVGSEWPLSRKTKQLAVFFPGVGYHKDKPLLYYSRKLAADMEFEVVTVAFSGLPVNMKGDAVKMKQAFDLAYGQAEEQLSEIAFGKYDRVIFVGKSIGTVIAGTYAKRHGIFAEFIVYTPVPQTFEAIIGDKVRVFHGLDDSWCENDICEKLCKEKGFHLTEYAGANHSLETGNVAHDLNTLSCVMEETREFFSRTVKEKE